MDLSCPTCSLRIPLRRFVTQAFFSALATLIPNLLHIWDVLLISGLIAPVLVLAAYHALALCNPPAKFRSPLYCMLVGHSLAYLHQVTTLIGQRLPASGTGISPAQHAAIHFCLAFFVISELEFRYSYVEFKGFKGRDELMGCLKADFDRGFAVSRDPFRYGYGELCTHRGQDHMPSEKENWLHLGQFLLFLVLCGLSTISLKSALNPGSGGLKEESMALAGVGIFLTTESAWQLLLNPVLLRVVRQANHVGFWAAVETVRWFKMGTEAHKKLPW